MGVEPLSSECAKEMGERQFSGSIASLNPYPASFLEPSCAHDHGHGTSELDMDFSPG